MNDTTATATATATTTAGSARAWPIGIVVGLGAVVLANVVMISIALSNPAVPADADHWQASLEWDRELTQRSRSAALGWRIEGLERSPEGLSLSLVDAEGRPLLGLLGALSIERGDSDRFDAQLELRELGAGRYLAPIDPELSGAVSLRLTLRDPEGQEFLAREQLELPKLQAQVARE